MPEREYKWKNEVEIVNIYIIFPLLVAQQFEALQQALQDISQELTLLLFHFHFFDNWFLLKLEELLKIIGLFL